MPASVWEGDSGAAARRAAWIGTALALAVFLLLATSGRPWTVFDRGPFTSDFYDVQARALTRGRLSVPPDVASIEGYVVDGATHFYYGLVPALARMPISAVTTAAAGRLVVLSQLGGVAVACMAGARLFRRAQRALGVELAAAGERWMTGGFAAAVGIGTPLLWLSSRALVYHEAELWGAALTVLGFERIVAWWETRRPRDLLWCALVATLALSTRASPGAGPALALGGLAVVLAARSRWRTAACVAGAAAVPVALYAAVNLARFGTPFSIPFDRQVLNAFSEARRAALDDNDGTLFGLKFAPTTVLQYLRPDTLEVRSLLPWFSWGDRAHLVGDVTFDTVDRSASLPVAAPAFLAASIPGIVALFRRRPPAAWPIVFAAGVVATIPTVSIAFIANRYLADFVPALVVGAALGVPVVAAWATRSRRRLLGTVGATAALMTLALVVNAGLSVLARRLYLLPEQDERRAFVALQYDVHDALAGSPPPYVSRVAEVGPAGADGELAIVGDCDALYRSDGEQWSLLEARPGGALRAVVEGTRSGLVAGGDGWRIDLVEDGSGVERFVYVGTDADGAPIEIAGQRLARDGPVRADITADPAVPTVAVRVDGSLVLEAFLRRAGGPLEVADGWRSIAGRAELCAELLARGDQ